MRFDDQRALLIKELRLAGISDERVLQVFNTIPRELFVPSRIWSTPSAI
jgi:protein-L-isoaspartate O-methyltransferase